MARPARVREKWLTRNARSVKRDLGRFAVLAKCSHLCVRTAGYCLATIAKTGSFTAELAATIVSAKHSAAASTIAQIL